MINENFKKIEDLLKEETNKIVEYYKNDNKHFNSNVFDVQVLKEYTDENLDNCSKEPAIYIFKIINDVTIEDNKFNNVLYGAKTNFEGNEFKIGDTLYVGKSFDIKKRLIEHTIKAGDKTYSLRLFEKYRNSILNNSFNIYIFKCLNKDYYKMILSIVETNLHEILQPKVGTKRL